MKAKIIIGFFFLILTSCVTLAVWSNHAPAIDINTGCRLGRTDRPVTIIILDQSNKFEIGDIERAKDMANNIVQTLATDEKLITLELDPNAPFEPKILFDRCAPKAREEWNIFIDNIKKLTEEADVFFNLFNKSTKEAFERKKLSKSPIIETISYVTSRTDFKQSVSKKIFIFSDLLQNYGRLDFYKVIPRHDAVSEDSLNIDPLSLDGAKFYLLTAARRQQWGKRSSVQIFWNDWLKYRGATVEWSYTKNPNVNTVR